MTGCWCRQGPCEIHRQNANSIGSFLITISLFVVKVFTGVSAALEILQMIIGLIMVLIIKTKSDLGKINESLTITFKNIVIHR